MTPMFGADPEEADNMELGVRYSEGTTNIEAFYFASDYSRLAAECTLVSGASCDADESAVTLILNSPRRPEATLVQFSGISSTVMFE